MKLSPLAKVSLEAYFNASSCSPINCSFSYVYPKSNRALLGGETIRFGHYRTEFRNKIKRVWKPNCLRPKLFSEAMQETIKLIVTDNVLRKIETQGGLDAYILGQRTLESKLAAKLKNKILMAKLMEEFQSEDY